MTPQAHLILPHEPVASVGATTQTQNARTVATIAIVFAEGIKNVLASETKKARHLPRFFC